MSILRRGNDPLMGVFPNNGNNTFITPRDKSGSPPPIFNPTHMLLVGVSADTYGFTNGAYGTVTPPTIDTMMIDQFRVFEPADSWNFQLAGGLQIPLMSQVDILFEGGGTGILTWNGSNRYTGVVVGSGQLLKDKVGETLNVIITPMT